MSAAPPSSERSQTARRDKDGKPTFDWQLTSSSILDTVKLVAGPFNVLPVIFVPGIMGSNLRNKSGAPVWRLDAGIGGIPWGMLKGFATKGPGPRQQLLHPDRCVVDAGGAIPSELGGSVHSKEEYRQRGWGTVGEGSYHKFLLWLEKQLNPTTRNPARWLEYYQAEATISGPPTPGDEPKLFAGIRMGMKGQPFNSEKPFQSILTDDLIARSKFILPVYAAGYNWLANNRMAAVLLQTKITEIIKENNGGGLSLRASNSRYPFNGRARGPGLCATGRHE